MVRCVFFHDINGLNYLHQDKNIMKNPAAKGYRRFSSTLHIRYASGKALAVRCANVGVPRSGVDPVGENPTQVIDCSPGRAIDSHTREGAAEALLLQIINP
ncbi:hypothetical protein WJR50_33775 [Catalinimonas sp. 4WD22]|uniref:hypothetical protein n=1 Tax=Catalinimonas locisalis TaxID=3133978 RepID=UPI00310182CD